MSRWETPLQLAVPVLVFSGIGLVFLDSLLGTGWIPWVGFALMAVAVLPVAIFLVLWLLVGAIGKLVFLAAVIAAPFVWGYSLIVWAYHRLRPSN